MPTMPASGAQVDTLLLNVNVARIYWEGTLRVVPNCIAVAGWYFSNSCSSAGSMIGVSQQGQESSALTNGAGIGREKLLARK